MTFAHSAHIDTPSEIVFLNMMVNVIYAQTKLFKSEFVLRETVNLIASGEEMALLLFTMTQV